MSSQPSIDESTDSGAAHDGNESARVGDHAESQTTRPGISISNARTWGLRGIADAVECTALWHGSTRALALVRIGVVVLLWSRLALNHAWFNALPDRRLLAMYVVFYVASLLMFVGLWTRAAMGALAVFATVELFYDARVLHLADVVSEGEWQVIALLALTPAGRSLSVDRWIALRRAEKRGEEPPSEYGPLWGQWLLLVHLSALYFYAAMDKTGSDWLLGMRMDGVLLSFWGTNESLRHHPGLAWALLLGAWGTTLTEFSVAILPWFRRTRPYALAAGVVLHLSLFTFLALWPLSMRMMLLYILFFPPEDVHDGIDRLLGRGSNVQPK